MNWSLLLLPACLTLLHPAEVAWARGHHKPLTAFSLASFSSVLPENTPLTLHPSVPGPSRRRILAGCWSRKSWMWARLTPRLWPLSFCWGFPWCECWGWGCSCQQFWWKGALMGDSPRLRPGSSSHPAACWAGCICSAAPRSARPELESVWPAAPGGFWSAGLWHKAHHPSSCLLSPARPHEPSGSPGTSSWTHHHLCGSSCWKRWQNCLWVYNALISSSHSPSYHLRRRAAVNVNICGSN